MPNGDGGLWKFQGLINLADVDHTQWHIEVARCLRMLADQIESKGLNSPIFGKIRIGRINLDYVER